jgi:hypothetical protein
MFSSRKFLGDAVLDANARFLQTIANESEPAHLVDAGGRRRETNLSLPRSRPRRQGHGERPLFVVALR